MFKTMGSIKEMSTRIIQDGIRIFWSNMIRINLKLLRRSFTYVQKKIINLYLKLRSFNIKIR